MKSCKYGREQYGLASCGQTASRLEALVTAGGFGRWRCFLCSSLRRSAPNLSSSTSILRLACTSPRQSVQAAAVSRLRRSACVSPASLPPIPSSAETPRWKLYFGRYMRKLQTGASFQARAWQTRIATLARVQHARARP